MQRPLDQIDRRILKELLGNARLTSTQLSERVGLSAAEQLRISIGSAHSLVDELDDEVRGVDTISGLPRKATITSEEVREALAPPLLQIVETIRATLDGCSTDLASDLVDNGLVLAGGGSLLRGLDRFLQEQTGLPARYCGDPLTAVARGTYLCLEHFDRSVADCQAALRLNRHHFGAQAGLGQCYLRLRRHRAALRAFRVALRINPRLDGIAETVRVLENALGEEGR